MIKTSPSPTQADESIKAKAWKNIIFLKNGHSCLVQYDYVSEAKAIEHMHQYEKVLNSQPRYVLRDGTEFSPIDYSHTIQIPWNREG